jgi:Fe(3+) dicitrate transport protein
LNTYSFGIQRVLLILVTAILCHSLQTTGSAAPREEPLHVPLTGVIGTGPEALEHIPGSGRVVTQKEIWENHRMTVNEALREVPGVNVRDEAGLGLRPNIGIRGLDPT